MQEASRFAAGFFQQPDFLDVHAAVDGLAHIINGQKADAYRGERFHFDAGTAEGLDRDLEAYAGARGIEFELGGNAGYGKRMAKRDEVGGAFGSLNGGEAGNADDVAFFA